MFPPHRKVDVFAGVMQLLFDLLRQALDDRHAGLLLSRSDCRCQRGDNLRGLSGLARSQVRHVQLILQVHIGSPERLDLLRAQFVQDRLCLVLDRQPRGGAFRLHDILGLHGCQPVVAATLCELALHAVEALQDAGLHVKAPVKVRHLVPGQARLDIVQPVHDRALVEAPLHVSADKTGCVVSSESSAEAVTESEEQEQQDNPNLLSYRLFIRYFYHLLVRDSSAYLFNLSKILVCE